MLNRFIRSDTDAAIAQAASFSPEQRAVLRAAVDAAEPVSANTCRSSLTEAKKTELLERLR